ncbi:DUF721 domain-containing protein [Pseudoalteromonas sp. MMG010]|uniref:DUF721 domain-containing protein n=1 Tax=Pseudoalteromonas sp. MMG010 TaxID=2822685 RepID=UPI001B3A6065|nr:DUF721 domain-containing protein [Pseudoalteromonas sp. MMG010]MBQ4834182.1 DUF721 domain-containing protein [Pseudoalteromonas sp. MMG010]
MAKDKYAPKPLGDIMAGWNNRLSAYAGKSNTLDKQQTLLSEFLGAKLGDKCRVSNYREGTLMIEAVSAPIALRLNYLKMDIMSHFRAAGIIDLAQIKITANPQATQRITGNIKRATSNNKLTSLTMSKDTAEHLQALAASAPASLKEKLERLAQHAKK